MTLYAKMRGQSLGETGWRYFACQKLPRFCEESVAAVLGFHDDGIVIMSLRMRHCTVHVLVPLSF